jgi:hypothetical protein
MQSLKKAEDLLRAAELFTSEKSNIICLTCVTTIEADSEKTHRYPSIYSDCEDFPHLAADYNQRPPLTLSEKNAVKDSQ